MIFYQILPKQSCIYCYYHNHLPPMVMSIFYYTTANVTLSVFVQNINERTKGISRKSSFPIISILCICKFLYCIIFTHQTSRHYFEITIEAPKNTAVNASSTKSAGHMAFCQISQAKLAYHHTIRDHLSYAVSVVYYFVYH